MVTRKYKLRAGSQSKVRDLPRLVTEEFHAVRALGLKFTKRVLLDRARDKAHPLHGCFDWNNSRAAEKYRLEQARQLIMLIVLEESNGVHTVGRTFYSVERTPRDLEYVHRDLLSPAEIKKHEASLWRRVESACAEAAALKLERKYQRWHSLTAFVRRNATNDGEVA